MEGESDREESIKQRERKLRKEREGRVTFSRTKIPLQQQILYNTISRA